MAEFLDPPCMKTSPVLCETSLFSYYFEIWPPLSKVIVFLCYMLFNSLLEGCYLIFMDPVNGYSKPKLLLKEQVSLKSKITYVSSNFCYPNFLLLSIFTCSCSVKAIKPLALSISSSELTDGKIYTENHIKEHIVN